YDATKSRDNGDVATDSSVTNSMNVGNANIYGHVSTGPNGLVAIGANGAVGAKAWQAAGNKGIEPGWSSDDMNVFLPDVKAPFAGGFSPIGGIGLDGVHYDYILTTGNWLISSGTFGGKVLVTGNAALLVDSGAAIKFS